MEYNSPLIMRELSRLKQEEIKRDFQNAQHNAIVFREWQEQFNQKLNNWFATRATKQATPRRSKLAKQ
jgi:hypothetical protein